MRQNHRKLSDTIREENDSASGSNGSGTMVRDGMRTPSASGSREDLFSCLLCVESFRKPKILDCQHAFCEHCLQQYYKTYNVIQYEKQEVFVPCPTCRKLTRVPADGLQGLDQHKYDDRVGELKRKMSTINSASIQKCDVCVFKTKLEESEYYCSKCMLNFCSDCKTAHSRQVLFKNHTVIHISNKETIQLTCDAHNKNPSHYFCQDCNHPICTVCVMHEHSEHNTVKLHEALSMRRDNVKTLLNCLGPKMDKLEAKVKKLAYLSAVKSRNKNGMSRSISEVTDMASSPQNGVSVETKSRKFSLMELPQNRDFIDQDLTIQAKYCEVRHATYCVSFPLAQPCYPNENVLNGQSACTIPKARFRCLKRKIRDEQQIGKYKTLLFFLKSQKVPFCRCKRVKSNAASYLLVSTIKYQCEKQIAHNTCKLSACFCRLSHKTNTGENRSF